VGNNLNNAGHFFCFGGVDPLDDGMGNFRLHKSALQCVFRELGTHVLAEIPEAADFGDECGAGNTGSVDGAVCRGFVLKGLVTDFSAQTLGSVHNGVNDHAVAGAAAGVAVFLEPVAHIFSGWVAVLVQQSFGGNNEAGCTEAALERMVEDKCFLNRMEIERCSDTFNRGD